MRTTATALVKRGVSRARWYYRRVTCRYRCLPDFVIIGAQKSGTTSLYSYLSQHSELVPSTKKEIHFFCGGLDPAVDTFSKGLCWYRTFFPLSRSMKETDRAFEASPNYLFSPLAPKRIVELVPNVKLIVVLRNPTERAVSHYFHSIRLGHETLPIMEALDAENARLSSALTTKDYKDRRFIQQSYKSRGLYYEQLTRYIKHFAMDDILILSSESLFKTPAETLKRIYHFIGVDEESIADLKPRNVGGNRAIVESHVYSYLNDFFRPHNHKLYDLVEQRFDWDDKP